MGNLKSLGLVLSVYACFLVFGFTQEKIYKYEGVDGGKYSYFMFLVFVMCTGNIFLAGGMLAYTMGSIADVKKKLWGSLDKSIIWQLFLTSVTYVTSLLATNYALTHVTYPTQVIVKSIKMVPVTLGGLVFFGKRYPWYDYVAVVTISSSLVMFNLMTAKAKDQTQTYLGVFFLFVSLACDSLTGPRQDSILAKCPTLDATQLLFFTNIFAICIAGAASLLFEGAAPVTYCIRNPAILGWIGCFCFGAAFGQLAIFHCLKAFGALYLTLITTTRKFFTILLSVLWYGHHMNPVQWLCVATIFTSLGTQGYLAKSTKNKKKARALADKAGDPLCHDVALKLSAEDDDAATSLKSKSTETSDYDSIGCAQMPKRTSISTHHAGARC